MYLSNHQDTINELGIADRIGGDLLKTPLDEIVDQEVLMTISDGEIVYQK